MQLFLNQSQPNTFEKNCRSCKRWWIRLLHGLASHPRGMETCRGSTPFWLRFLQRLPPVFSSFSKLTQRYCSRSASAFVIFHPCEVWCWCVFHQIIIVHSFPMWNHKTIGSFRILWALRTIRNDKGMRKVQKLPRTGFFLLPKIVNAHLSNFDVSRNWFLNFEHWVFFSILFSARSVEVIHIIT